MERAGLKPGAYNGEASIAGKTPAAQNRNAPAGAGAQFPTGILYHNGDAGQVKKLGAKERKLKTRTLRTAGCGTQIRPGPLSLRHPPGVYVAAFSGVGHRAEDRVG